ncbi:hypothetical protein SHIRM173S_12809 [Streptomyces hirsutus]
MDPREAFNTLDGANRRYAPAVDKDGRLAGILTRKGALRATLYTPATTTGDGCASPRPSASTAMSRARPSSCWTRASTRSSSTRRTGIRSR